MCYRAPPGRAGPRRDAPWLFVRSRGRLAVAGLGGRSAALVPRRWRWWRRAFASGAAELIVANLPYRAGRASPAVLVPPPFAACVVEYSQRPLEIFAGLTRPAAHQEDHVSFYECFMDLTRRSDLHSLRDDLFG